MEKLNPSRIITTIAVVVLVVGAALFYFFRTTLTSEGLYNVQQAIGMNPSPPERHIVAEGFNGWAVLQYGVEGAPELVTADNVIVIEYPPSGRLQTSTPPADNNGLLHKGYYEKHGDSVVPLERLSSIWGEYTLTRMIDDEGEVHGRSVGFFVGSLSEFRDNPRPGRRSRSRSRSRRFSPRLCPT